MHILQTISAAIAAALKYAPYVNAAVQNVESAIGAGNGATKKQLAVSIVLSLAHEGETIPVPAVQIVSGLVDATVTTLNSLGVFGHGATAPATA